MLGDLLGIGAAIIGGRKSAEAMKNVENRIKDSATQAQAENQSWYDRRYNEDSTQRADAQRILTLMNENIKNRNKAAAGTAAVMGGTEESLAATKAANAQAMSDAASRIAVAGEARKDDIEQQYMQNKKDTRERLANQLNNLDMAKAENIAKAAQGVAEAGSSMDDSLRSGATEAAKLLLGLI